MLHSHGRAHRRVKQSLPVAGELHEAWTDSHHPPLRPRPHKGNKDFGLGQSQASATVTGDCLNHLDYLSPEQRGYARRLERNWEQGIVKLFCPATYDYVL